MILAEFLPESIPLPLEVIHNIQTQVELISPKTEPSPDPCDSSLKLVLNKSLGFAYLWYSQAILHISKVL